MILYFCTVLLGFFFILAMLSKMNASVFYAQVFFWVFGFVGFLSVVYLEFQSVYIIEQFRFSQFNGASAILVLFFVMHFLGVLAGGRVFRRKFSSLIAREAVNFDRGQGGFIKAAFFGVALFVLCLLYFNVYLSDPPPLLGSGYIDRFDYIQNTRLWWVVSPLGVVAVPLPIILGWLLVCCQKKFSVIVMAFLYFLYLALIGQKFGGFILGFFLILLPSVSVKAIRCRVSQVSPKVVFIGGAVLFLALSVVYYHYSNFALADDFGGPLGLIAYRVFGLQGHAFWGGVDNFVVDPLSFFDPLSLQNGMQNLMRMISPSIADDMIERGVSFSFGYFASLLVHLSFLAFPFALFVGFVHSVLVFSVIDSVVKSRAISYFLLANVLVAFNGFISMGSLSYVLNYKIVVVLLCFGVVKLFFNLRRRSGCLKACESTAYSCESCTNP